MEREAIERQLAKVGASIASAEAAAENQSARVAAPEAGKHSDKLVELLLARLLRMAYRDNLLRELSLRFVRSIKGRL